MVFLDVLSRRGKRDPAGPRRETGPRLDWPVQRIEPASEADHPTITNEQRSALRELCATVRERSGARATTALLVGASGRDRLSIAAFVARDLRLDLYRVDLGAVSSGYIGETEKNLGHVLQAARGSGGVVLLLDEADALFGKRSEIRDAHDRYANLEPEDLLQHLDGLDGLAMFAANMRGNLDPAFLRRLRFTVDFTRRAEDAERRPGDDPRV